MKSFIIFLTLATSITSCYFEEDFSPQEIRKKTKVIEGITFDKEEAIANGKDKVRIQIFLPVEAADELSDVTISTTKGTFIDSGKTKTSGKAKLDFLNPEDKDPSRFYTAFLKSDLQVGTATLEIIAGETQRDTTIEFTRNHPDTLFIVPSTIAIKSDFTSEIDISVMLSSSNGTVSSGQPITIDARDSANMAIGTFRVKTLKCDSNVCVSKYTVAPDTIYTGPITLVTTTEGTNQTLSNQVIIYAIN